MRTGGGLRAPRAVRCDAVQRSGLGSFAAPVERHERRAHPEASRRIGLAVVQKNRCASNGVGANAASAAVRRSNRNRPVRSAISMRSPAPSANEPVARRHRPVSSTPVRGSKRCSSWPNVSHQYSTPSAADHVGHSPFAACARRTVRRRSSSPHHTGSSTPNSMMRSGGMPSESVSGLALRIMYSSSQRRHFGNARGPSTRTMRGRARK